jgi:hypothetical protein
MEVVVVMMMTMICVRFAIFCIVKEQIFPFVTPFINMESQHLYRHQMQRGIVHSCEMEGARQETDLGLLKLQQRHSYGDAVRN